MNYFPKNIFIAYRFQFLSIINVFKICFIIKLLFIATKIPKDKRIKRHRIELKLFEHNLNKISIYLEWERQQRMQNKRIKKYEEARNSVLLSQFQYCYIMCLLFVFNFLFAVFHQKRHFSDRFPLFFSLFYCVSTEWYAMACVTFALSFWLNWNNDIFFLAILVICCVVGIFSSVIFVYFDNTLRLTLHE